MKHHTYMRAPDSATSSSIIYESQGVERFIYIGTVEVIGSVQTQFCNEVLTPYDETKKGKK